MRAAHVLFVLVCRCCVAGGVSWRPTAAAADVINEPPTASFASDPEENGGCLRQLPATRPCDFDTNCLPYKVLARFSEYEVRRYAQSSWLSTVLVTPNRVLAALQGHHRLVGFISRIRSSTNNSLAGATVRMGKPIVLQMKHARHPGVIRELEDYTVSSPLVGDVRELDADTRQAAAEQQILVDSVQEHVVYARTWRCFPWDLTDSFLRSAAANLTLAMRQHGHTFFDRYVFLASYDSGSTELLASSATVYELWFYGAQYSATGVLRNSGSAPETAQVLTNSPATTSTRRKLCRGMECPTFDVLSVYTHGIQKRRYRDSVFATASPPDCAFTALSVWKGLMPLQLYRHGINSQLEVIEPTRPVGLVQVHESTGDAKCGDNVTVAMYLPSRLHASPPQRGSSAPAVRVTRVQDLVVFAWPVGGYLLDPSRVRAELRSFKHHLRAAGLCFNESSYYVAFYDFLVRFHGRQNELWLSATTCVESVMAEEGHASLELPVPASDQRSSNNNGDDDYYGLNVAAFYPDDDEVPGNPTP
ncbi:unnamed protein product [Notodromas monacha]|uniref:Uncharacterized protein n=1 Tax=Notodromas monacha TaxID=399045 RepID=A0A7R9BY56_9CRUS|nr:unnamed protein product [Notodromas monacha]CAG0922592.1 unnamed protein product [Notodromas monacha]